MKRMHWAMNFGHVTPKVLNRSVITFMFSEKGGRGRRSDRDR